jgi:hypothetical protein
MKPQAPCAPDDPSGQAPKRKAYRKPLLKVYGDLTEITQNVKFTMTNDGAGHPNQHFTS